MKLNIQFANGEEREVELPGDDFKMTIRKIFLDKIILTGDNEIFVTDMIVKIEGEDNGN